MDKTSWMHEEKSKNCTSPLYTCVCLKCIKALKKHTYQSYLVYPRRDEIAFHHMFVHFCETINFFSFRLEPRVIEISSLV